MIVVHVYYHYSRTCYAIPKRRMDRLIRARFIFWFNEEWTVLCSEYNLMQVGHAIKEV